MTTEGSLTQEASRVHSSKGFAFPAYGFDNGQHKTWVSKEDDSFENFPSLLIAAQELPAATWYGEATFEGYSLPSLQAEIQSFEDVFRAPELVREFRIRIAETIVSKGGELWVVHTRFSPRFFDHLGFVYGQKIGKKGQPIKTKGWLMDDEDAAWAFRVMGSGEGHKYFHPVTPDGLRNPKEPIRTNKFERDFFVSDTTEQWLIEQVRPLPDFVEAAMGDSFAKDIAYATYHPYASSGHRFDDLLEYSGYVRSVIARRPYIKSGGSAGEFRMPMSEVKRAAVWLRSEWLRRGITANDVLDMTRRGVVTS